MYASAELRTRGGVRRAGIPTLPMNSFAFLYTLPLVRLCDFMVGICFAQLMQHEEVVAWRGWRYVADLSCLVVGVVSIGLKLSPRVEEQFRGGYELFFISGFTPLMGIALFGSSADTTGVLGKLANHSVWRGLGEYGFTVYLFQDLVFQIFVVLQQYESGRGRPLSESYLTTFTFWFYTYGRVLQ